MTTLSSATSHPSSHGLPEQIAVILHDEFSDLSWLLPILQSHGAQTHLVRPFRGDEFPDVSAYSGVISMGGLQHIYQNDRGAYLDDEEAFIRNAVDSEVPVLGICLGSQILASALGGRAIPGSNGDECGPLQIHVRDQSADSVLAGQSGVYFSMHEDSFEVPPGADLLAWSDLYPQAFRWGTALGIQFHPEISPEGMASFVAALPARFRTSGHEPEQVIAWGHKDRDVLHRSAETLLGRWVEAEVKSLSSHRSETQ
jgi:GMP synthase (glutamine-hydrolysing)